MGSGLQIALWLVVVITSSTACYHFGASIGSQHSEAVCQDNAVAYAISDTRRALEMLAEPAADASQAALTNLRHALFRLSERAPALRDWDCSAEDRAMLTEARRALEDDPDRPEWLDARVAPAWGLCPDA